MELTARDTELLVQAECGAQVSIEWVADRADIAVGIDLNTGIADIMRLPLQYGEPYTMAVLHEIGHVKVTKSHPITMHDNMLTKVGVATAAILANEAAAWEWAIDYAERHGKISAEGWARIESALRGYGLAYGGEPSDIPAIYLRIYRMAYTEGAERA